MKATALTSTATEFCEKEHGNEN